VDSSAEAFDLDAALELWLMKQADAEGVDLGALRRKELEVWGRWKQNPNPQDFEWLYNSHKPVIYRAGERYLNSTTLPKAAVRSDMLRQYVNALSSYDPSKGAAIPTHIFKHMQHTGRYITKYQNIGRIPEERAQIIGLYENRRAHLREHFGREPSNAELADDMNASMAEVADLNRSTKKITPRTIETLRREVRRDLLAESPGAETHSEASKLLDHLIFLHGSLSPEQQVVLEHTFDGFGKPVIENPVELGPVVGMSPQKIRALRKQIATQVRRYY
jgi:DNA-directed RNA polymerase specialized sigma subunit